MTFESLLHRRDCERLLSRSSLCRLVSGWSARRAPRLRGKRPNPPPGHRPRRRPRRPRQERHLWRRRCQSCRRSHRALTRASDWRPGEWTPPKPPGTCASSRKRRRRKRSSAPPVPTSRSPANTPSRGTTTAFRSGTSPTRKAHAREGVSLPRVAERRLGLQEPALRVRRGPDGPPRLRHAGRARAGQQGSAAWHPDLRRHRHGQPEVRGQRADLPRFAHAHRGDGPERQGERVHLCLWLGRRSVSGRVARVHGRTRGRSRIPHASASRSSACRSRRRSKRRS